MTVIASQGKQSSASRGTLDCFVASLLAMTLLRQESALPRHDLPESCVRFAPSQMRGRREGRVSTDPHGPRATRKTRGGYHRFSRKTRPSLRDGATVSFVLSP